VAPRSLRDSLEQAFIVAYQGTKVVVMQDMKQYTDTLPMVKTKTTNMQAFTYIIKDAVDISTNAGPPKAYNLTDFQVRNSVMFGDFPLAILDNND